MLPQKLTLDEVYDKITEYQECGDHKYLWDLLPTFEGLLIRVVMQIRSKYPKLYYIPVQELYHTSIIGMQKALQTRPLEEHYGKIPQRIAAYAKSEIYQVYKSNIAEIPMSNYMDDFNLIDISVYETHDIVDKDLENLFQADIDIIDDLVYNDKVSIDKKYYDVLKEYYMRGATLEGLGKKYGVSHQTIKNWISNVIDKFNKEKKL